MLPKERRPNSHKGDNGQVAIIGGSETMHGAPLFAALAAEATGVDLIFVAVPRCHTEVAKQTSLNFQVHPFAGNAFAKKDVTSLLELVNAVDCAVIGPGVAEGSSYLEALIRGARCPLVLDAGALQAGTLEWLQGKTAVLTPHAGELQRLGLSMDELQRRAREKAVTFFVKGPVDQVISPDHEPRTIAGGNAGLTVGGSGDALAGLIGGLMAQGIAPYEACLMAGNVMKKAAEELFESVGYAFTALDLIDEIPVLWPVLDTTND